MAGPGARLEKAGTIFSRIRGLLRSGALKDTEKPIWYEVYMAFPPRDEPTHERTEPTNEIPNILYREDFVRAKFYKTYGNPDVIDMRNHGSLTISERFIKKYFEIQKEGPPDNMSIFEAAGEALKSQGIKLKTLDEILKEKQALVAERIAAAKAQNQKEAPSARSHVQSADVEDTLDEEIESPDYEAQFRKDKPKE